MVALATLRYLATQCDACAFRFWPARPFQAGDFTGPVSQPRNRRSKRR